MENHFLILTILKGFPGGSAGKESAWNARDGVPYLALEDPLVHGMATRSSILAWRIPWTEEPGGLQFKRNFKRNKLICL